MTQAPRISRRRLLAGAAALPLFGLPGRRARAAGIDLRVGAVLPLAGESVPVAADNLAEVGAAARQGLILAEEDLQRNAALLGNDVTLLQANAPTPEAVRRAARRLVAHDGAHVLIGGYGTASAEVLSEVAQETGTLFLNIGATSDTLRGEGCRPLTFHVEASAAMYLDAIAGWYVRAGHRRWHLVHATDAEGQARRARARAALSERHWGVQIVGETAVRPGQRDLQDAVAATADTQSDVVLLLTDWLTQLDFLSRYEAAGLATPVTGFPEPAAQTRHFYALARQSAPTAGTGHRAALWEATLQSYGARELNARYGGRWGRPMDPAAWAGYQAFKIAYEAALFSRQTGGSGLADYLRRDGVVFDVHKGIGVSFRPWDHQLRQSLFLVHVNPARDQGNDYARLAARADLVGELPAIYKPGTEPVERLDQLGDIRPGAVCQSS